MYCRYRSKGNLDGAAPWIHRFEFNQISFPPKIAHDKVSGNPHAFLIVAGDDKRMVFPFPTTNVCSCAHPSGSAK
jgi:hypothetical protein